MTTTDSLTPATCKFLLDNIAEVERLLNRAMSGASASIRFDVEQARLCNNTSRRVIARMAPEEEDVSNG